MADGKNTFYLEERRMKAYGIVSEIVAILREVPLGKYEIEAGLKLRNAMFLYGILTNCEIWYGIKTVSYTHLTLPTKRIV